MKNQEKIHKQIDMEVDKDFQKKINDAIKMGLFDPVPLAIADLMKLSRQFDETEGMGYNWMNTCILWIYLKGMAICKNKRKEEEEPL